MFYFILLPFGVYHIISTSCPSYLLPLEGHFIYCHLRVILFTVPGGAKSQTGINIIKVRKRAVLRTFLFKKIASLQNLKVFCKTRSKKPLQWPGASVYSFILCLTAFVLRLSSRSESSHLIFCFILFFFFFFYLCKSQDKQ